MFIVRSSIFAAVLVPALGCSKLVPAEGTVTLDGQPLPGATILFFPEEPEGRQAAAPSNKNGTFRLYTDSKVGAQPGNYKVTVSKMKIISASEGYETLPRYSKAVQTPLRIEVPKEGKTDIEIQLKGGDEKSDGRGE